MGDSQQAEDPVPTGAPDAQSEHADSDRRPEAEVRAQNTPNTEAAPERAPHDEPQEARASESAEQAPESPAPEADAAREPREGEAPASALAEEPTSESQGSERQDSEASAAAAEDTAAGASEGEAASSSAATVEAQGAEAPAGKRKRRRRKKKKPGEEGEAGEADAEGKAKKRREVTAPFGRFFAGAHAAKKHAFAAGEVVAGRVTAVEHGAIVIDLFGKATAVCDEFEPREVPPEPVAPAPESATPKAAESESPAQPEPLQAQLSEPHAESAAYEVSGGAADSGSGEGGDAAQNALPGDSAPEPPAGGERVEASGDAVESGSLQTADREPAQDDGQQDAGQQDVGQGADPDTGQAPAEVTAAAEHAEQEQPGEPAAQESSEGGPQPDAAPSEPQQAEAAAEPSAEPAEQAEQAAAPATESSRGPLPPAPVVPEKAGRPEPPRVGQVFRGRVGAVAESGHIAIVNRIIDRPAVRAEIERCREQRRRVEGLVFGFNRGGFDVLVAGMRGFCPASAMALEEIDDPHRYVGQKLEFLLSTSQVGRDIVVGRRSILERQQRRKAKELVKSLSPGQRLKGRVTHVRDFGLFVDIGGVEGLVHLSELSYGHGVKPSEVAQPGDEVEVQVLRVGGEPRRGADGRDAREGGRRDRVTRVSLSIKALLPDPWDEHAETLQEGAVREGTITRTTEFGAFVELAPQIEGLVHITELGRDLKHANQAVTEGDRLHVVVERVDKKARRISLSKLSAAELEEYQQGQVEGVEPPRVVRPGSRITVRVDRVEHRGVVVRVSGVLGRRARGFIPNSEMGGDRGADYRKKFPQGAEIEVKVIGIDRDGGLRCSPKALRIDEERRAVKDYRREASKQGFGTFGDLLKAKLDQVTPKS